MDTTKCTLGAIPGKYRVCNQADCPTCGWNADEMARRREYLQQHGLNGLTICADGKCRMVIKRASAQENAAPGGANSEDG